MATQDQNVEQAVAHTGIVPALFTYAQLTAYVGLTRSRIYSLMREGTFPRPVKVGKSSRWPKVQIDQWIAGLGTVPYVLPGRRKSASVTGVQL